MLPWTKPDEIESEEDKTGFLSNCLTTQLIENGVNVLETKVVIGISHSEIIVRPPRRLRQLLTKEGNGAALQTQPVEGRVVCTWDLCSMHARHICKHTQIHTQAHAHA